MKIIKQNLGVLPLWLLCLVFMIGLVSSTEAQAVYSEDFSTDPGWTTNAPSLFYWNSGAQTYSATQVNVNGGGNYSYYNVGHDGSSFSLAWDVVLHSVSYASGLTFGMFDTDLDSQSPSYAKVEFTRADQGLFVVMSHMDSGGNGSHTDYVSTPPDQFSLDTWYNVLMQYDDLAGTLTAEITKRATGVHFTSLSLSGLSSLGSDVGYIASSNVRTGNFQVSGAQTVGEFDNVYFTPEPATMGLLLLGGLVLVRFQKSIRS